MISHEEYGQLRDAAQILDREGWHQLAADVRDKAIRGHQEAQDDDESDET